MYNSIIRAIRDEAQALLDTFEQQPVLGEHPRLQALFKAPYAAARERRLMMETVVTIDGHSFTEATA